MHLVSLAVTDFRNLRRHRHRARPRGDHGDHRAATGPARPACSRPPPTWPPSSRSGARPRRPWCARGPDRAILRAETRVEDRSLDHRGRGDRPPGRSRTQVNRQAVRRRGDLHEALRVTVFSPEDIGVVRAGPADRRRFLDETLAVVDPEGRPVGRGGGEGPAPAGGPAARRRPDARAPTRPPPSTSGTPGWTRPAPRLVEAREAAGRPAGAAGRRALRPAGRRSRPTSGWPTGGRGPGPCSTPWPTPATRTSQRGVTTVGPHRDELELTLAGLPVADPRLPGRAALAGPGPPAGRPPAGHRAAGHGPGAAARRRVLRARPLPVPGPARRAPAGPGPAHHRPAGPARRWTAAKVYAMAPAAGGHAGGAGVSPEPPHRRDSEPRPLDGVARRLCPDGWAWREPAGLGRLFAGWPEIVGRGDGRARPAGPDRRDRPWW